MMVVPLEVLREKILKKFFHHRIPNATTRETGTEYMLMYT